MGKISMAKPKSLSSKMNGVGKLNKRANLNKLKFPNPFRTSLKRENMLRTSLLTNLSIMEKILRITGMKKRAPQSVKILTQQNIVK